MTTEIRILSETKGSTTFVVKGVLLILEFKNITDRDPVPHETDVVVIDSLLARVAASFWEIMEPGD